MCIESATARYPSEHSLNLLRLGILGLSLSKALLHNILIAEPVSTTETWKTEAVVWDRVVCALGRVPEVIVCDNGFDSVEWRKFCHDLGAVPSLTSPYNPRANTVERPHRFLKALFRINAQAMGQSSWPMLVQTEVRAYNSLATATQRQLVPGRLLKIVRWNQHDDVASYCLSNNSGVSHHILSNFIYYNHIISSHILSYIIYYPVLQTRWLPSYFPSFLVSFLVSNCHDDHTSHPSNEEMHTAPLSTESDLLARTIFRQIVYEHCAYKEVK